MADVPSTPCVSACKCGASASRTGDPTWLRVVHGVVSAGAFVTFCFVIVAGVHGIAPLFVFALPDSGSHDAELIVCLIWGCASALAASHFLSSASIGGVARLFALASLWGVWSYIATEFRIFGDVDALLMTATTSLPFFGASLTELVLDVVALCGRRTWTFTNRDLMLLMLASVGFVLPKVIS